MSNFSHNLPILRRRAEYTQEALAEALDVSRQAVSKWESGQTLPEAATLITLADLLGCTLDQLMREELADDGPGATRQDRDEEERYALKALRGDFQGLGDGDGRDPAGVGKAIQAVRR